MLHETVIVRFGEGWTLTREAGVGTSVDKKDSDQIKYCLRGGPWCILSPDCWAISESEEILIVHHSGK